MDAAGLPDTAPDSDDLSAHFHVYGIRRDGDRLLYFGEPQVPANRLEAAVWETFREAGYEVRLRDADSDDERRTAVLVADPVSLGLDGVPWTNLILFLATVASTLYVGAMWYHIDLQADLLAIVDAWPFAAGVLVVLGVHELGHYLMSRYYGVQASLPYFLPVPTIFGTMGAVISIRGRIPDRRSLFDIGVAGPLAGLVATVVVTIVGLHLPPVSVPQSVVDSEATIELAIGFPPLLEFLAWLVDQPLRYSDPQLSTNPVVLAGWLGMFITFLNLIPVGQLDGGHMVRAMAGELKTYLGVIIPASLFTLSIVLVGVFDVPLHAVTVWVVWGVFATILARVGPADPIDDSELDRKRQLLGLVTLAIGALCFTPVPIEILS